MTAASSNKDLSLKWLELFQTYARTNSLQATAKETRLSISTVSHHLRNLEEHLGVDLFDHTRRLMVLTPTGRNFLRNIAQAMSYCRVWCLRVLGHAAIWLGLVVSIPSLNVTPLMTLAR